ncbi:restriction endonuclease subunit S [Xanthomonas oryzae pv. oryzae]|uniref:restriction endonuclease subunit S n=1 Tax=Xanthomonas oryzae TaxID=347 RepID=UPI00067F2AD1|nr:restriction endonuclease subunit S [Xanthomonas oryzae]
MVSELPGGWTSCQLGDLLDHIQAGKNVKCDERPPEGEEPGLVKISAVTWGKFDELESKTLLSDDGLEARNKIQPGDLLISRANTLELVGAPVIVHAITKNLYLSDKVLRLDLAEPLRAWALTCLKSKSGRSQIEALATGNQLSMRNISQDALRSIELPLPPLAEQKRIAQKLDALLAQVDTLKARIDAMPALLKRFREATLTSAMSGTLTKDWRIESSQSTAPEAPRMCRQLLANERERIWRGRGKYKPAVRSGEVDASEFSNLPEVWHRGTLDEITWSVKDGPHFSPKYATDGVRFISGGNIRPGRIDLSTGKYISQELHEELSARCKPEYLDVLYTKGGTTGFAAVNRTESEFNVWVHVAVLKMLPPSVVDPFFVEFALNSPECYAQSQRYTHGVGNQDLGLRRMIKIVLPVPPIGEQREIVRRVEQLFAYADQLEAKVATAKQRIDALTQSLLAKAFRGELVPQDPAAEPASVLLDRIRAQRAATPKPKRGRKAATS